MKNDSFFNKVKDLQKEDEALSRRGIFRRIKHLGKLVKVTYQINPCVFNEQRMRMKRKMERQDGNR